MWLRALAAVHAAHAVYFALGLVTIAAQPIAHETWVLDGLLIATLHVAAIWAGIAPVLGPAVLALLDVVATAEADTHWVEVRRTTFHMRYVLHQILFFWCLRHAC